MRRTCETKELERFEDNVWLELFEEYLYSGDKNKIETTNRIISASDDSECGIVKSTLSALRQLVKEKWDMLGT